MEKPLLIKSQEPVGSISSSPSPGSNPMSAFYNNSERLKTGPQIPGKSTVEYFENTPGLFTYNRDRARAMHRARFREREKLADFMENGESPIQVPKFLRPYYENFVSEYFAYYGSSWKLFDRIIVYILIVYVFFLVALFIKRLIFSYKPKFMVTDGFVGDILWYVKDKQVYHKFKLFYIINLFIFISAVFVMAFVFVNIFKIVQTWEAFFYYTHVNYCVPTVKGNQHYLRSLNWFFSKQESYTAAGINRKQFVQMLYYPKNGIYNWTRIYTDLQRVEFREEGFSETDIELYRPRITKLDRMVFSNLPPYFWNSFEVLPSNKPYVSAGCSAPR